MNIFKSIVGGVKKKIVDPFKRFVNRNKKALITAAILGATIYTGGALAGWWAGTGKLAAGATALAGTGKIAGISASALKGVASTVATTAGTQAAQKVIQKTVTGEDPFRVPEPEIRGQLQPLSVEGPTMARNLEFGFGAYS
jgi:hypothetical protein